MVSLSLQLALFLVPILSCIQQGWLAFLSSFWENFTACSRAKEDYGKQSVLKRLWNPRLVTAHTQGWSDWVPDRRHLLLLPQRAEKGDHRAVDGFMALSSALETIFINSQNGRNVVILFSKRKLSLSEAKSLGWHILIADRARVRISIRVHILYKSYKSYKEKKCRSRFEEMK